MGAAVKAGGILLLYRLFALTAGAPVFREIFWGLAVVTMVLGNLMALPQQNLKRLLAYSSVAHAGYIATGFFGGADGLKAALYYLAVYAMATMGAFGVVAAVEKQRLPQRAQQLLLRAQLLPALPQRLYQDHFLRRHRCQQLQ